MSQPLANSFLVRKLSPIRKRPLDAILWPDNAHEVACEELRLTSFELEARLAARELRASDLVQIRGTWTPIVEAPQFAELAVPHARRERRRYTLKSALILLGTIAVVLAPQALKFWFLATCPHCHPAAQTSAAR